MQPPEQHSWNNLTELKSQIVRKLGPERSKQYFDYLNKFLSLKISKVEFDKLCVRTIGRDGIALHNKLIRSILKNACVSVPVGNKKPLDGVYLQNGSALPNGSRIVSCERKGGDRKSVSSSSSPDTRKSGYQHHHQELHAPLGIPYAGGARSRAPPTKSAGVSDTSSLLDTVTLRARMEPVVATHGLQGVSMDSANAVNAGLGVYLKRIIRSCTELNTDREPKRAISLLDLRVAMELNPQQLGEDSSILLERICTHAFEE